MKPIHDSKISKKQFLKGTPGNFAELREPFGNARKQMRPVESNVGSSRSGSLQELFPTAIRRVAAA